MDVNLDHNSVDSLEVRKVSCSPKKEADLDKLLHEGRVLAQEVRRHQRRPTYLKQKIRELKAYWTVGTNWLINRKRDKEGREDFLPLYFIWTTTRSCNFRCTYCCDHQGNMYPELPNKGVLDTKQSKKLLDVMRTRTASVYYAGGEPLLRRDLSELVEYASSIGYYPQTINTNGSLFHNRLKQKGWENLLANTDLVVVSLDDIDLDNLEKLYVYNQPGNILRNIFLLNELKEEYSFKLMVNCVIRKGELEAANKVLDFANRYGITFTGVPVNEYAKVTEGLIDDLEYKKLHKKILRRHKEGQRFAGSYRFNERLYSAAPLTCRNTLKPHIDFDGQLFWPCKAAVNVKPLKIPVLNFKHIDEIWKYGRSIISPDKFHGQDCNQCGGNCNWAQNYSTDCYAYGLKNPKQALKDMADYAAK